ncbi:MAG: hypothetical protein LBT49_03970 [Prevotellaceae bacterium]|jgi:hypothetical protein|nr:hypothetical protein [Prevotellaceae bacterium]
MTTKEDINKLTALLSEMTKIVNKMAESLSDSVKELKKPQEKTPKKPAEATTTIVDSFKAQASINDSVAKPKSSISVNQPVSDIAKAIGINDRFLFIRELFDGDKARYTQTMNKLNTMNNLEEAKKYIQSVVQHWDETTETAQLFLSILQRRYL